MVKVGGSSEILASFIDFFETSFRQSVKILEGVFFGKPGLRMFRLCPGPHLKT